MGGLVTEQVRPGVEFIPEAAAAFRRAEAQVIREFGRPIDVNSTYRSWADQMVMFVDWSKWVNGTGPRPAHSKAVHPSESFHVQGLALDSDDWRVPRIVQILAENGFIRNRLHVKGEQHHFEYIRARDTNYGEKVDDVSADDVWKYPVKGRPGGDVPAIQELADAKTAAEKVRDELAPVTRGGKRVPMRQDLADTGTLVRQVLAEQKATTAALRALASAQGADPDAIQDIVREAVKDAMRDVSFTVDVE